MTVRHASPSTACCPGRSTPTACAAPTRRAPPKGQAVEEALRGAKMNPAGRFGTPDEFGAACAFLCSEQAGYITGQNRLIDGGAYPGTY